MNDDPDEKMSQEEIWAVIHGIEMTEEEKEMWVVLDKNAPYENWRDYRPYGRDWKGMLPVLPKDINVFFSNGLPKTTLLIEADMACDCYLLAFDFRMSEYPNYEINPRNQGFGGHGVRVRLWVLPVRRCDGRAFTHNEEKHVYAIECEISIFGPGHYDEKRYEQLGPYSWPPRFPFSIKKNETDYVAEYVSEYPDHKQDPRHVCDYVATKATAKTQAEALKIFSAYYQPLFPEAIAQLCALLRKPSKRKSNTTTHDSPPVARQQVSKLWNKYNSDCRAYFGRPTYKEFWENSDWQSLLQKAGVQSFEQLKKVIHSLRMAKHRNREK